MLRLPTFDVVSPTSVQGVIEALSTPGARLLAGGTDLLPNLKHGLASPPLLVNLLNVKGLGHLTRSHTELRIGACVSLAEVSEHPDVQAVAPSLARAAGLVAGPTLRNTATLGGNVHLDTRCRWVNQTEFWRSALGGCMKSEGDVCHVVRGGQKCVAAMSSDCVPALISLDASAVLVGPHGQREVPLREYYTADGLRNIDKARDELMIELRIPVATAPRRATYVKWAVRRSIDFPLISVALRFDLEHDSVDSCLKGLAVVVGVLGAKPRVVGRLEGLLGTPLSAAHVTERVCAMVKAQSRPLNNVMYDAGYRRNMLPVYTRRAMAALIAAG